MDVTAFATKMDAYGFENNVYASWTKTRTKQPKSILIIQYVS